MLPKSNSRPSDFSVLLKAVSRSFYLSMQVLPNNTRQPIGLAYLLARAADTLSDAPVLSIEARKKALAVFRQWINHPADFDPLVSTPWIAFFSSHAHTGEKQLLASLPDIFFSYQHLSADFFQPVQTVLTTLTEGMVQDLTWHDQETDGVFQLVTKADTDKYTYLVAGCVGEFWTHIMTKTTQLRLEREKMKTVGVSFGKGLQWVNILRDIPGDFHNHRVYLSQELFTEHGVSIEMLKKQIIPGAGLNSDFEDKLKIHGMIQKQINVARKHLTDGLTYIAGLPRFALRLRLAVTWPLWIGLQTLQLLETSDDFLRSPKISRRSVYRLMAISLIFSMHDGLLSWYTHRRYGSTRQSHS